MSPVALEVVQTLRELEGATDAARAAFNLLVHVFRRLPVEDQDLVADELRHILCDYGRSPARRRFADLIIPAMVWGTALQDLAKKRRRSDAADAGA